MTLLSDILASQLQLQIAGITAVGGDQKEVLVRHPRETATTSAPMSDSQAVDKQQTLAVTIRAAQPSDLNTIQIIGAETFSKNFGHSMPEEDMIDYLAKYKVTVKEEMLDSASNVFFVAEDVNTRSVVGFIQMKRGTSEPCFPKQAELREIHRIYVDDAHASKGIGARLMEKGWSWARDEMSRHFTSCACGVWLGVWEENEKAQKFYENLGYNHTAGAHDFVIGQTVQTDDILIKWFSPYDR